MIAKYFTLALLVLTGSAQACHRCGLFGNRCRYAASYVAPVVYAPPVQSQNFVFNNSFPVPYLAQGNTAYAYSLAASPYTFDSAAYMDRASRFQELALETAQQGINGFNANAAQATALADAVDRRTKNTMLALSAIQANQQVPVAGQSAVQSQSFRATVTNGRLAIERIDDSTGQLIPPGQPGPPQNGPQSSSTPTNLVDQVCAKCHDGTGQHSEPKDSVFTSLSVIDPKHFQAAVEQVSLGKMPKDLKLNDAEKLQMIQALSQLLAR